jgi:hypothetical protein
MKSRSSPARAAPGPKPGVKIHNQFLPADRATQILLQQFL